MHPAGYATHASRAVPPPSPRYRRALLLLRRVLGHQLAELYRIGAIHAPDLLAALEKEEERLTPRGLRELSQRLDRVGFGLHELDVVPATQTDGWTW